MSFNGYKDIIEENDKVILYLGFNSMYPLQVTPTKANRKGDIVEHVFQTSYGALKVKDLIGKRFGTRVPMTRGYGYVLHPTPELWTKTLPHRTQILYSTDISLILLQLDLKPGSVVVESGTGSGSLSHSFIRTVAPTGHLHTFDFHPQRVALATQEFKEHKVDHLVTAKLADACADGFGLEDVADAVFLDLPHPWEAIVHAKISLKKKTGGRICSFSPCIEQVMKTAAKMKEEGFTEISTVECLLREFQVRKVTLMAFDPLRQPTIPHRASDEPDAKRLKGDNDIDEKEIEFTSSEPKPSEQKSFVTGVPLLKMAGHTGFLTFATLAPENRI